MSAFDGFKSPFWRGFWDGYPLATLCFFSGLGGFLVAILLGKLVLP